MLKKRSQSPFQNVMGGVCYGQTPEHGPQAQPPIFRDQPKVSGCNVPPVGAWVRSQILRWHELIPTDALE
jgi:hypothetical protein